MKKITLPVIILTILLLLSGCVNRIETSENIASNGFKLMSFSSEEELQEKLNELLEKEINDYDRFSVKLGVADQVLEKGSYASEPYRYSETNVQVKGIDEADIVKTNGRVIAFSPSSWYTESTYLVKPLPITDAKVIKTLHKSGYLYLNNDLLILLPQTSYYYQKEIVAYNISNPENPKIVWSLDLNGSYVDSRLHNGKLYLVVSQNKLKYPLTWNNYKIPIKNIYLPIIPPEYRFSYHIPYIISKIDIESGKIENALVLLGNTYDTILYLSPNNLYLTYNLEMNEEKLFLKFIQQNAGKYFPSTIANKLNRILSNKDFSEESKVREIRRIMRNYFYFSSSEEAHNLENQINNDFEQFLEKNWEKYEITGIAKIDLDEFKITYANVSGHLLNSFAMDEYKGYLRLATTIGDWRTRDKMTNNIYVLDKNLKTVGKLTGLEKGERIYAVRFIEDKAYLVTYQETDPLLVIDLSNPFKPKILGELKIPGFSTYLHPIGNNLFIGIGKSEDMYLKVSLFDVSDFENPKELDKYVLKDEWWSPALYEHHAFLWDDKYKVLFLPVNEHAYIFQINNNKIKMVKDDEHESEVLRALFINDYMYTFSYDEIHILNEKIWNIEKTIKFPKVNIIYQKI
ncbi:MAG: hypothetical protein GXN99_02050 [Candidatus Nanohaloarchaeota archaeon]|nr:hypothetical protein [Candidatus Nanohaloarchaeota archaeon]